MEGFCIVDIAGSKGYVWIFRVVLGDCKITVYQRKCRSLSESKVQDKSCRIETMTMVPIPLTSVSGSW